MPFICTPKLFGTPHPKNTFGDDNLHTPYDLIFLRNCNIITLPVPKVSSIGCKMQTPPSYSSFLNLRVNIGIQITL